MQPYSIELRREVLADCDAGMGTMAVALKHRVSDSWVRRLKQRRRETGEIAARPPRKKTPPKWLAYADRLRALVDQRPDSTLRELREALGCDISLQTISAALRTLKYTFKKSLAGGRARSPRHRRPKGGLASPPSGVRSAKARVPRRNVGENQPDPDARSSPSRSTSRGSGAPRPLEDHNLPGRIAGQRINGPLSGRWSINGELFLGHVRQQLVPALSPGDIVVMDNLSAHEVAGGRAAIEAREARLVYLPPYSPDLNPIELVFSKFKWLVRSAVERTVDGLWRLCGQLLDQFTSTECRNYFRHCGYTATEILETL